jgi:hypothetical protein
MKSVTVPLDEPLAEALRRLAQRELRPPRLQAAILLREALRRAGELPDDRNERSDRDRRS